MLMSKGINLLKTWMHIRIIPFKVDSDSDDSYRQPFHSGCKNWPRIFQSNPSRISLSAALYVALVYSAADSSHLSFTIIQYEDHIAA
jgi:hypothetical protein